MQKNISNIIFLFIFSVACFRLSAQDLILKINGDTIRAKVTEIGISTVSYKKASMLTGPTFTEEKVLISSIKYANGEEQKFDKEIATSTTSVTGTTSNTTQSQSNGKNKIEMLDGKYFINGQPASRKDVNRYLEKSNNPAIVISLKTAKATANAQKIIKITSIPTTIAGSFTSLITIVNAYQLVQRGRANVGAFVKMGLSIVGTASLPITSRILKKKRDKMYDKVIDMYNVTN